MLQVLLLRIASGVEVGGSRRGHRKADTGRGCREEKRKIFISESANKGDNKDLPVNIRTTFCGIVEPCALC